MEATKIEEIKKLRSSGKTYKEISISLNVPVGSIKCILFRKKEKPDGLFCKNCGVQLSSFKNRKKRIFCSTKCKRDWWYKNRQFENSKLRQRSICQCCGKEIFDYGSRHRKFCSLECYRKRRGEKNGT